jgi:xanthine dehydrogenase YagS FAD-binding subunit
MVIQNRKGERVVDAEDYFISPSIDIMRMTILGPGDLLTAIRLPNDWAGAQYYFEKVSDRQAWDFALVSVASAMKVSGGTIQEARIAVNGVAPYPVRVDAAEAAVRGKPMNEETAVLAGDVAIRRTQPLRHNDYKVPLMKNLVKRSVRGTSA